MTAFALIVTYINSESGETFTVEISPLLGRKILNGIAMLLMHELNLLSVFVKVMPTKY